MAFQSCLTETEQVEELMELKEDIKIMKKILNVVQWRIQLKTARTTTKRTSSTNFGKQSRGHPHETRLTIQREPAQPLEFLDRCRHKLFS